MIKSSGIMSFKQISLCVCMGMIFNQIPMFGYANAAEAAKDLKTSTPAKDQFAVPDWATPVAPWPLVNKIVTQSIEKILASPDVKNAMTYLKSDESQALKEAVLLSEIPAPPFTEEAKAKMRAASKKRWNK